MTQATRRADDFRHRLREAVRHKEANARPLTNAKHAIIYYTGGNSGAPVYYIDSGRVKLLGRSPEGKECWRVINEETRTDYKACTARAAGQPRVYRAWAERSRPALDSNSAALSVSKQP